MDDAPVVRKVKTLFWPGQVVFLRVSEEPLPGMISATHVRLGGAIDHTVAWADREESIHYEAELSAEFVPDYARGEDEPEADVRAGGTD